MSLINLLNEQKKEQEVSNVKNTARTIISTAAVAGTAYMLSENINLKAGIKKSYGVLKNSSAAQNELGVAGNVIRQDGEQLKKIINESKLVTLTKFKDEILNDTNLEKLFDQSSSPEEARAFISALFDTASSEITDDSGTLKATLERLYQGVGTPSIEESDKQTAIDFYKSNIRTSESRLEEFKKRHSLMMRTRGQFNTVLTEFSTEGTNTVEWKSMSVTELGSDARKKFDELKSMSSGKNIQLVSIEEYGPGKGKSAYARVEHGNGRFQNIALSLVRDEKTGTAIMRGTENLSTRYTVTGGVLDVTKLFPSLNLNQLSTPGEITAAQAMRNATMTFEDHMFEMIKENRRAYQNFNARNINQYNDYIRSMSVDTPRTMIAGLNSSRIVDGKTVNLIDEDLMSALVDSRRFQSSIHKIAGLEKLSAKDREQVTRKILQYESEIFGGTSGAQTLTSRFINPFDLNEERVIGHIERLRNDDGSRTPTAFNVMRRYGYLDRSLIPQTARAGQVYGRPEVAAGFLGVDSDATFGKGDGIKITGRHSELIGVTRDDVAKNVRGVNFGAIMVFEKLKEAEHKGKVIKNPAAQLGLGEGMSYMGGTIQIKRGVTKTVNREGINQSQLLTEILEAARDTNRNFITIGSTDAGDDYNIDEFFKKFGDSEGRAVLGKQDDRIVHIKRHKGMRRFKIGLSEKSMETGRDRYHLTAQHLQDVTHSKLFSSLAKDTTITVSEDSMLKKLNDLGIEDIGRAYFDSNQFGGKIANTLLTTTAQLGKSAHYLRTQIHGGMRMLGLNEKDMSDALDKSMKELNDTSVLLAEINNNQLGEFKSALTSLDQVTAEQRSASTLGKFFQTIAERAGSEGISADHFGMVMSYARDRAANKKFGLNIDYFEEKVAQGLREAGIEDSKVEDYLSKIEETAKRGVVIGAAFGTVGTPHTDLGRNAAKAEPRFANYLYTSLRSFWGMDSKEATNYVSSMITRMEGFESRAGGLIGMKITQESLGKLDAKSIQEQISGLEDVEKLSKDEIMELMEFGQGREREVVQKLSERKGGNILDLEDIGLSKNALDEFYKFTGGKKEIFLPGEDTFKGFLGHEIRSAEETIKIEAEYSRNITDLLSSLSSLKDAGTDKDQIDAALKGFKTVRSSLSKVAGTAIRNSLSGRILGSGSYMGGGFTIGKGGVGATIFSDDKKIQAQILESISEVVNKEMGYVSFMDQQAFLDGMSTYESAVDRHLASQGNVSRRKETSRIMFETLEAFFTGMHGKEKRGVSGTVQRNPVLGFSHIFAGMGIYQYDFTEELKPLSYLRNITDGEEFTEGYKEHLKEIRRALNQPKITEALTGEADLDDEIKRNAIFERSQEIFEERKKRKAQREAIKAEDGYEAFVKEREALINKRKVVSESLDQNPFTDLRRFLFEAGNRQEMHLDALDRDIDEVQRLRKNKLDLLPGLITSAEADLELKEEKLAKLLAESPDSIEEIEKARKNKEAAALEVQKLQKQIPQIERQLELADENKARFGRPVLGGGDITEGNIRRAIEYDHKAVFEETLEDFGAQIARDDGLLREGTDATDVFYRRSGGKEFRHFDDYKQAASFINEMAPFFGFKSAGAAVDGDMFENEYLQRLYQTGRYDKIYDDGGKHIHSSTRLEQINAFANREYIASRIKEIRSGGAGMININLATKEELMSIKGVGSKTADEIIRVRNQGLIIDEEDFLNRATGLERAQRGKAAKAFRSKSFTYAPKATKLGAYEVLTMAKRNTEVYARDEAFYRDRAESQRITREIEELDKNPLRKRQEKRQDLYTQIEKLNEEEEILKEQKEKIKDAQAKVQADGDSLTLGDIDRMIMEGDEELSKLGIDTNYSEARLQARTSPRTNSDLLLLDEALGGGRKVRTGADLAELRSRHEMSTLTPEQSGAYKRIYKHMQRAHMRYGDHGGGIIRMPQIDMSMKIKDTISGATTNYSGRMDFARFAIGDFDADPYQVFFDVDKSLRRKVELNKVDATKMYTYGAEFLTNMSLLGEGIDALGKRMNASQMTTAQSIVDEYQKEQIVKGIGGLDVQVKAGMLGLAQAAAEDTSGDFANQFKRIQAGAALVSVAQEVLGIKGKKLPIAANISREYLSALKESYKTGSGDALKNFFQQKIFKGTLLENANANLKVDMSSIEFHNLGDGEATKKLRQGLAGVNLSVQEIFDSFDIMAKNVKKYGLNNFTSNASLGRVLEGSSRFSSQQLFQLLNRGMSMEGGLITGEMEEIENIFGKLETARNTLTSSISRGKGLAGIVAGSLVTSYAIGANSSIGSLEPGGKFSDNSSREALRAGENLSNRALQQSFSREHGNINPGRISGLDNFYERPINNGVSTVSLNRSVRMYGEAPSLSTAQSMGKHFVSAGGQASLTVNDNRRPIGAAYINKMIRD